LRVVNGLVQFLKNRDCCEKDEKILSGESCMESQSLLRPLIENQFFPDKLHLITVFTEISSKYSISADFFDQLQADSL
jgi:hypothetical protein